MLGGRALPLLLAVARLQACAASELTLEERHIQDDDECSNGAFHDGACVLSALQHTGVPSARLRLRRPAAPAGLSEMREEVQVREEQRRSAGRREGDETEQREEEEAGEEKETIEYAVPDDLDLSSTLSGLEIANLETQLARSRLSPIAVFNDILDSLKSMGSGIFYEFRTALGELVFEGQSEGRLGTHADAKTRFPLASASKLFTAFAAMRTMELKPKDWHPQRLVHSFQGWEDFRDFPVHGSSRRANLTLHHLLTHTSGLPFGMRMSKEDLARQTLFYTPGTSFGYTLGHRIISWLLRDYWRAQPEAAHVGIRTVQDAFKWLIFDELGLSPETRFSTMLQEMFGYDGQAGDASITSTGEDLMKLAVVALRKGRLPSGRVLISERNWNRWAVPNLLPGGQLSEQLVDWQGQAGNWENWNVGGLKEQIMKQSGAYGWNYFGATYNGSKEVGWCGFFSSCLRVTYEHRLAFVMMQRDVADLKKSKPYLVGYFGRMAQSLQCPRSRLSIRSAKRPFYCGVLSFMKKCKNGKDGQGAGTRRSGRTVFCNNDGETVNWTSSCQISTERGKAWHKDRKLDEHHHTCYVPLPLAS